MTRRRLLVAGTATLASLALPALAQDKPALQRIRERGSLVTVDGVTMPGL